MDVGLVKIDTNVRPFVRISVTWKKLCDKYEVLEDEACSNN